jgi:LysM repeat protein
MRNLLWIRRLLVLLIVALATTGMLLPIQAVQSQDDTGPIHTVQAGETLFAIARAYDVDVETLTALNDIEDPDAIVEGQKLRLPAGTTAPVSADQPTGMTPARTPTPTPRAATATPSVSPPANYRVLAGDTLFNIARRFRVPVATLSELNDLDEAGTIYEGQVLQLRPSTAAASPTPPPTPPPTSQPDVTQSTATYTVEAGDTLFSIARRFSLSVTRLQDLNNLADVDAIFDGQVLTVVDSGRTPEAATPKPTQTPTLATAALPAVASPTPPVEYVVEAGDTLYNIARRFGISLETLRSLNDLGDSDDIYVGQKLKVDGAPTTPEVTPTPLSNATAPAVAEVAATHTVAILRRMDTPLERSGSQIASLNRTYTVHSGDSLNLIALRLGVDADALVRLNKLGDLAAPLTTGQVLLLPATGEELRPSVPAEEHVVQSGETLSAIAQSFDLTLGDLLRANRIADPNAVYPGQSLLIPPRALGDDAADRQIGPPRGGYFYYTVQSGDTLSTLAREFNSTMPALREYNNLPDNDSVYAGLELRIPYGAPPLSLRQPPAPKSGTRFIVSISRQQCWVYQGERVAYSWSCSTGAGERRTKAGNYAVQSKILNAKSNVFKLDMPYWLGIYDVGPFENGIHGLPVAWNTGKKIWSGLIGQPATFGCAMLDDPEAATLFRLAYLGMPVHIVN